MSILQIRPECLKSFWGDLMTKPIKSMVCLALVIVIICFSGCIERFIGTETDIGSVKLITPEDIESIFAEISFEAIEKYPIETDENGEPLVFWLEGGTVWHTSRLCGSIERADPEIVFQGTVRDAYNAGKERACKVCSDNEVILTDIFPESSIVTPDTANLTNTESDTLNTDSAETTAEDFETAEVTTDRYPKDYNTNGDLMVFWLDSGEVWHVSRSCSSLSRSDPDEIKFGTEEDAVDSGKKRVCKICTK